jgi:energy-coupling factor transport system substrate-specific component
MNEKDPPMNTAQQHAANMERARVLALIPFGIALNLGLGTLITSLKIPLYLDAVATVAVTLLAGFRAGAIVGVASNLIGGVLVNPVLPWYCGTQFLLAAYTALVAKQGWVATTNAEGSKIPKWVLTLRLLAVGIGLGLVSAFASAPVSVFLFSGITGSGPSVVVAVLLKAGKSVMSAVLSTAVFLDPLDKTVALLIAIGLIRALPPSLKLAFGGGYLKKNRLEGS